MRIHDVIIRLRDRQRAIERQIAEKRTPGAAAFAEEATLFGIREGLAEAEKMLLEALADADAERRKHRL